MVRCRHPNNPDLIPTEGEPDGKGNWLVPQAVFCAFIAYGFVDVDVPAGEPIKTWWDLNEMAQILSHARPFSDRELVEFCLAHPSTIIAATAGNQ